jgi:hypothetical protein
MLRTDYHPASSLQQAILKSDTKVFCNHLVSPDETLLQEGRDALHLLLLHNGKLNPPTRMQMGNALLDAYAAMAKQEPGNIKWKEEFENTYKLIQSTSFMPLSKKYTAIKEEFTPCINAHLAINGEKHTVPGKEANIKAVKPPMATR